MSSPEQPSTQPSAASHDHTHAHAQQTNRTRLAIAFALTFIVFLAQVTGSILTGSLALIVDTVHMLTDCAGLAMALLAAQLVRRPATDRHPFGLRRVEIISAMLQALLLFAVGVYAIVEGVMRLFEPAQITGNLLIVFGVIGLAANLLSMLVLTAGRSSSLNMRAAFLEVINDALGSVAVIVSAGLIWAFGWNRADAVAGLIIALLILPRTIALFRSGFGVLLEGTPKEVELEQVREHFEQLPHVLAVHDLHITRISSDLSVLTAHVVVDHDSIDAEKLANILSDLQRCAAEHLPIAIEHSTFQIEPAGTLSHEHMQH
ncbi:cation diffusion facilitator family transporter [Pseudoclavibacter soli]|uniref:cation diffusion facilitator family transporter n=1 Tax=Pseudoclavibacter soli TaxID=452623 RepID=UPI00040DC3C2|nr:cation diffusion facilitator family transporter [Pseudoclavibacter soli]